MVLPGPRGTVGEGPKFDGGGGGGPSVASTRGVVSLLRNPQLQAWPEQEKRQPQQNEPEQKKPLEKNVEIHNEDEDRGQRGS